MRTTIPVDRPQKKGWHETHHFISSSLKNSNTSLLLLGDSIINGLTRYDSVWREFFKPYKAINCGISGDKTQHVLWRTIDMSIPCTVRFIVINVGTNNIDSDHPREICEGIMRIAHKLRKKSSNAKIIVTGLLPRDLYWSERRKKIIDVNHQLKYCCENRKDIFFLEQDSNW